MIRYISLAFLLLIACGSKDLSKYYYAFEDTDYPQKRTQALDYTVVINNFNTSSWLRSSNIPVRPSPNRIDFYEEYGWVSPPGELFAEYAFGILREGNIFSSILRSPSEADVQLRIEGTINHLELLSKEDSIYAWVDFEITCIKMNDHSIVATHSFSDKILLEEDATAQSFASLSSNIFHREYILFAEKCEAALESKK